MENHFEFDDKIKLHHIGWVAQKILWVVLFSFIILAILGLFGNGILSYMTANNKNISINYEKFLRANNATNIEIRAANFNQNIFISFPTSYAAQLNIEKTFPEPKRNSVSNGKTIYQFETQANTIIKFYIKPEKAGWLAGEISVNNTDFKLNHLIYP